MKLTRAPDAEAVALLAARRIADRLRAMPHLVLGLATGRTMERVYAELVRLHREDGLAFSRCTTFNLDEYAGLREDDPNSYRSFMDRHLFDLVDMERANTHLPDGLAPDPHVEGQRYEALIREAGGIGLQLLGLGENGHIGFNEPGSAFSSRTRSVDLAAETRRQNAALFARIEDVPSRAITVGIATIMEAGSVLLVATGDAKAPALARAVQGAATPAVPASALQIHPSCEVILDEAAASRLSL